MTGEAPKRISNLYLTEFQMLECMVGSNIKSTQARFNLGRITVLEGQVYIFWFCITGRLLTNMARPALLEKI